MNDRFKFRIWDKFCETWLTDFAINQDGKINKFFNSEEALKRRFVLMQSTGLKDKNGKLIYEGDIVEVINCRGANAVVEFDIDLVMFKLKGEKFASSALQHIRKDYFEVIGNIYENKELLNDTSYR